MLLEGLFLPLTTPFYPDGRLNLRKLEHNVQLYSKTPAAGLAVLSEQGEPSLLTDDETRQAMRSAIETATAEKVMLAGVSRDSVAGTVDLAEYAGSLDYDAVLVEMPSVLRGQGQGKELLAYFQSVADRSPLPLLLVSSAWQDRVLDARLVIELAGHSNIFGVMDASTETERIASIKAGTASVKRDVTVTMVFAAVTGRMRSSGEPAGGMYISAASLTDGATALAASPAKTALRTRTKSVGFQMLAGDTSAMLDAMRAGAAGAMPLLAACAPQACYEVLAAWKDEDAGLAHEKQARLQAAAKRIETELGVSGIKFGCDLNGYYGGGPRLPRLPLTAADRNEVEDLLRGMRS